VLAFIYGVVGVLFGLFVYVVCIFKSVKIISKNSVLRSRCMESYSFWSIYSMYVASGFVFRSFKCSGIPEITVTTCRYGMTCVTGYTGVYGV
jgi:hypothetical protein